MDVVSPQLITLDNATRAKATYIMSITTEQGRYTLFRNPITDRPSNLGNNDTKKFYARDRSLSHD